MDIAMIVAIVIAFKLMFKSCESSDKHDDVRRKNDGENAASAIYWLANVIGMVGAGIILALLLL